MQIITPPKTLTTLLSRAEQLSGKTIAQCALMAGTTVPCDHSRKKGWFGQVIERILGADASNHQCPDFTHLDIELKTLPINHNGRPSESTFVTSIQYERIAKETWETSAVFRKLNQVLWVPVEDSPKIPFSKRYVGSPFLWTPNPAELQTLKTDWLELTLMLSLGDVESISGRLGKALHIRPKAAHSKVLTTATGKDGKKIKTLPRGFYLRSTFTEAILLASY